MPDNKILCLAVDDEPPALQVIETYIKATPMLQLVGVCSNAVEALSVLQNNKTDLLFLDIQMPYILGTDFSQTVYIFPVADTPAIKHTRKYKQKLCKQAKNSKHSPIQNKRHWNGTKPSRLPVLHLAGKKR